MDITLYHSPLTRAERTKRILDFLGIDYQIVTIDRAAGDQFRNEYIKIHPLSQVPALKIDGVSYIESGACALTLADLFPTESAIGAVGSSSRQNYYEWTFLLYTTLEQIALKGGKPEDFEDAKEAMKKSLKALESRFQDNFMLGQQLTILDIMIHTEFLWFKLLGLFPEELTSIESYFQRVQSALDSSTEK